MAVSGILAFAFLGAAMLMVLVVARASFVQSKVRQRLQAPITGYVDPNAAPAPPPPPPVVESIFHRYYWLPFVTSITAGLIAYFLFHVMPIFCITIGIMLFVITMQVESGMADAKRAKCDNQLAEALDQMISAIRAGGSVVAAMERAAEEGKEPLKSELMTSLGLIRYGENASVVMRRLMDRVPLESFTLFSITMAVHFEVGGSLAPTLASVAAVIRDRIEISGRIRSLTAQSRASTVTLVLLTYGIAFLMWQHDPAQTLQFVTDPVGSWFVAGSMVGEAVGFVWLSEMARIK